MLQTQLYPKCPACKREFRPGDFWLGANFCRARFLFPLIATRPGLTTAEIAHESGMPYNLTLKALAKMRGYDLLEWDAEERTQGGQRYHYRVKPGWEKAVETWTIRGMI